MSTNLQRAWSRVFFELDDAHVQAALAFFEQAGYLDSRDERIWREAETAIRAEQHHRDEQAGRTVGWLRSELAGGECATTELKAHAERDGVAWRSIERAKVSAGAEAVKRGRAWWWTTTTTPPTPPVQAVSDEKLNGWIGTA